MGVPATEGRRRRTSAVELSTAVTHALTSDTNSCGSTTHVGKIITCSIVYINTSLNSHSIQVYVLGCLGDVCMSVT